MSSSKSGDNFTFFEVNLGGVSGGFLIQIIPDETPAKEDRVLFRFSTYGSGHDRNFANSTSAHTSVIIDKRYAKALILWFRKGSELMEKWYPEEANQIKVNEERMKRE